MCYTENIMKVGCHVSIAGGFLNAPKRGMEQGCEVMQIFSRSPQGGKVRPISEDDGAAFQTECAAKGIADVYVHTPYFINFASEDNRIRHGSIAVVREELERASLLRAKYVMTHLGSARGIDREEAVRRTIAGLKKTLENYAGTAKLLLENSAGSGFVLGSDLGELAEIMHEVNSKHIAGICLDTQHAFASGYDWNDFDAAMSRVDDEIGLKKIKLMHANDSKVACASNVDRHEHLGKGEIGEAAFKNLIAFASAYDIDMICETPLPGVVADIQFIKTLREKN